MQAQSTDIAKILTTNHPARPYLILGGLVTGIGLFRNRLSSLGFLMLGGALIAKGIEEAKRVEDFHDGNYHGVNGPPANR
jgi:hypothetical protein